MVSTRAPHQTMGLEVSWNCLSVILTSIPFIRAYLITRS